MSGRLRWEQDVAGCVAGRPHLLPILGDVLGVVDRVRKYNPDLFIVLNVSRMMQKAHGLPYKQWTPIPLGIIPKWNAWWEVHNLHENPTLVFPVKHGALDARVLRDLWETDVRVHGDRLFREMEAHNDRLEEAHKAEFGKRMDAIARDTASIFSRASWGANVFGAGGPPKTDLSLGNRAASSDAASFMRG